jgi:hypothetical protein
LFFLASLFGMPSSPINAGLVLATGWHRQEHVINRRSAICFTLAALVQIVAMMTFAVYPAAGTDHGNNREINGRRTDAATVRTYSSASVGEIARRAPCPLPVDRGERVVHRHVNTIVTVAPANKGGCRRQQAAQDPASHRPDARSDRRRRAEDREEYR